MTQAKDWMDCPDDNLKNDSCKGCPLWDKCIASDVSPNQDALPFILLD